ncbi:MAG: hypothetical protein ACK5KQ_07250 [Anaerorhabdus sp.]
MRKIIKFIMYILILTILVSCTENKVDKFSNFDSISMSLESEKEGIYKLVLYHEDGLVKFEQLDAYMNISALNLDEEKSKELAQLSEEEMNNENKDHSITIECFLSENKDAIIIRQITDFEKAKKEILLDEFVKTYELKGFEVTLE